MVEIIVIICVLLYFTKDDLFYFYERHKRYKLEEKRIKALENAQLLSDNPVDMKKFEKMLK